MDKIWNANLRVASETNICFRFSVSLVAWGGQVFAYIPGFRGESLVPAPRPSPLGSWLHRRKGVLQKGSSYPSKEVLSNLDSGSRQALRLRLLHCTHSPAFMVLSKCPKGHFGLWKLMKERISQNFSSSRKHKRMWIKGGREALCTRMLKKDHVLRNVNNRAGGEIEKDLCAPMPGSSEGGKAVCSGGW